MDEENQEFPHFQTLDELVAFVEENDLSPYLDQMEEVEFAIDLKGETLIVHLGIELARKLNKIAKAEGKFTHALIKDWLWEKVESSGETPPGDEVATKRRPLNRASFASLAGFIRRRLIAGGFNPRRSVIVYDPN